MTTNTNTTTVKEINAAIKAKAVELGYKFVRHTECPNCKEDIAREEQKRGRVISWANPVCAMLFSKKGEPNIVRCSCGYKHRMEPYKKKEVRYCPVCAEMGRKSKLPEGMDICYNPAHQGPKGIIPGKEAAAPEPKTDDNVRKCKCGNPLPNDRKRDCYTCVPKSKRATKSKKEPAQTLNM